MEHDLVNQVPTLQDTIQTVLLMVFGGYTGKKLLLFWLYTLAPKVNDWLGKQLFKQGEDRRMNRDDFAKMLFESEQRIVAAIESKDEQTPRRPAP